MELVTSQRFLCFLLLPILVVTNLDHQASALSILSSNQFKKGTTVRINCSADAIGIDPGITHGIRFVELSRKTNASNQRFTIFKVNNTDLNNYLYLPEDRAWKLVLPTIRQLRFQKYQRSVMKGVLTISDPGPDDAGEYFCTVTYRKGGQSRIVKVEKKDMLNYVSTTSILSSNQFTEGSIVNVTCSADAIDLDSGITDNIRSLELSRKPYGSNESVSIARLDNEEAIIAENPYYHYNAIIPIGREWKFDLPTKDDLIHRKFQRNVMKVVLMMKDPGRNDSGEYICRLKIRKSSGSMYLTDKDILHYYETPLQAMSKAGKGMSHSLWMIFGAAAISFMTK